jgi:hypothetical protein
MKDLIGKKVKGFKFEDRLSLSCVSSMTRYIDKIGVITLYLDYNESYMVEFDGGKQYQYPADQIEAHLVDEWVVGEEYEFSDGGIWYKRKLLAVLPEDFKCRFITHSMFENEHTCWNHIRPIEDPIQKQIEKLEKDLSELKQLTSK